MVKRLKIRLQRTLSFFIWQQIHLCACFIITTVHGASESHLRRSIASLRSTNASSESLFDRGWLVLVFLADQKSTLWDTNLKHIDMISLLTCFMDLITPWDSLGMGPQPHMRPLRDQQQHTLELQSSFSSSWSKVNIVRHTSQTHWYDITADLFHGLDNTLGQSWDGPWASWSYEATEESTKQHTLEFQTYRDWVVLLP